MSDHNIGNSNTVKINIPLNPDPEVEARENKEKRYLLVFIDNGDKGIFSEIGIYNTDEVTIEQYSKWKAEDRYEIEYITEDDIYEAFFWMLKRYLPEKED